MAFNEIRLEVFIVTDGHAGRGFDGFGRDEFCRVSLELVDAVDEGGAVNGFGGIGEWGGGGPLLEEVVDVGAGDGAGLTGGGWVDSERKCGFKGAKLDGTLDLRGHGVTVFGALGGGFRDGFEDATQ